MIGDNDCSMCHRPLTDRATFGDPALAFLCSDCGARHAAIIFARKCEAEAQACKLRSLGLTPAFHRDDAVARA